jgi:hypothetical protein
VAGQARGGGSALRRKRRGGVEVVEVEVGPEPPSFHHVRVVPDPPLPTSPST